MNKGQCIDEDGFRKSSFSPPKAITNPNCVAVRIVSEGVVMVRDTKDSARTTLTYTHDEWRAFVQGVKSGEFDIV